MRNWRHDLTDSRCVVKVATNLKEKPARAPRDISSGQCCVLSFAMLTPAFLFRHNLELQYDLYITVYHDNHYTIYCYIWIMCAVTFDTPNWKIGGHPRIAGEKQQVQPSTRFRAVFRIRHVTRVTSVGFCQLGRRRRRRRVRNEIPRKLRGNSNTRAHRDRSTPVSRRWRRRRR